MIFMIIRRKSTGESWLGGRWSTKSAKAFTKVGDCKNAVRQAIRRLSHVASAIDARADIEIDFYETPSPLTTKGAKEFLG